MKSVALRKFHETIKTKGEALAAKLKTLDIDQDGKLIIDGLVAALLSQEFGYKVEEAREIFSLVKKGDMFYYRDYLVNINPNLRLVLLNRTQTPTHNLSRADTKQSALLESRSNLSVSSIQDDPRLKVIKSKLKDYIQTNDITLSSLFQLIDSDSNQVLSQSEFIVKMRSLHVPLDDDELRVMFKALDKSGTGSITYK